MLNPDYVYGVIRKSVVLGAIAALVSLFAVSVLFAEAVVIGTLVSAINLRVLAFSMKKMLEAGLDGGTSAGGWSLLLAMKMLVLIGVIWILITVVNVNAVGFVFGFSLFMPAIGWQMLVSKPDGSEDDSEV